MADRNENDNTSQAAVAEINRSIQAVTAEISARRNAAIDAATTKRNRRFISARAATLSEAADIAGAAARQLAAARARILDESAKAEAAGAVDALSITPPRGATDSIRCAKPTCSPIAV
jgi:hypothetical protein